MRAIFTLLVLAGIITSLTLVYLVHERQELAATRGQPAHLSLDPDTDPSLALDPTAAGLSCDQERFYYGQSANGYNFVKEFGGDIYATRSSNQLVCLQTAESGYVARPCKLPPREFNRFTRALIGCTKSDLAPTASGVTFVF